MSSISDEKKLYKRLKMLSDAFLLPSSKVSDYKSILRTATKHFKVFTEADASVLMLNDNKEALIPVCSVGIPFSKIKDARLPSTMRLKDIISRPAFDVRYASFMNTPLIHNRKLIGLSAVFSTIPEKFNTFEHSKHENQFLTMLASYFAITIENITLTNTIKSIEHAIFEWENTFDAIDDLISVQDTDFNIIRANMAVARKFNMDIRDIPGKKCYKIFHGTEEPPKICPCCKSMETEVKYTMESENRHMGGIFNVTTFPFFNESRKCIGTILVMKDITEKKGTEELLKRNEEKYRLLIENIPDVVWTDDQNGNTTFISPNIERMYGYTPEEIYKDKAGTLLWFDRIHPDDVEKVKEAFDSLFKLNKVFDIEYRIKRKDGKWIWLHDRAVTTYKKDNTIYADGVFSDITERKNMWQQVIQSEKMSALGLLVAGIAHEINNPLSIIIGYTQSLLKEATEENQNKLTKILKHANRTANIVKQLVSFSRQEYATKEYVDIHQVIEEAISLFAHSLKTQNIQLVRKFDKLPLTVNCNANQIQQVFVNIISNALDTMQSQEDFEKILSVKTEIKGDSVWIHFKDTGCGISAENMKKIFDPFFTTKEIGKGTGLGLSICYKIIQDHRGKIQVSSQVGNGATFIVELPVTDTTDKNPPTFETVS